MVAAGYESFTPEAVEEQLNIMNELLDFTDQFLVPFEEMRAWEQNDEGTESPWIKHAQKIISGASDADLTHLMVTNQLVGFTEIGGVKPQIVSANCSAVVDTYGYNWYPIDPLDFGGLISADVIKGKISMNFNITALNQSLFFSKIQTRRYSPREFM